MTVLPTDYQNFIAVSKYSRWLDDKERRETWEETVDRYIDNVVKRVIYDTEVIGKLRHAIINLDVMPSMRALMTAGPALDRDNTCMYNCAYLPVNYIEAFDEAMFILLCSTGVGFSVERQYVNQLPDIPESFKLVGKTYLIEDSSLESSIT